MNNRIIILVVFLILGSGGVAWYFAANQDTQQLPQNGLPTDSISTSVNITYRPEDGPGNCNSGDPPVFTHDVTDLSRIEQILPPAGVIGRGELKTHSFLHNINRNEPVPVYAPADGVIAWGHYVVQQNERGEFDTSLGDEYAFFMELDCNHYIFFDHITNPKETIKAALPATPATSTRGQNLFDTSVTVKAGELLGETTGTFGGIWDFGVYDRRKKNVFPSSVKNVSLRDEQGICPYDLYRGDQREGYRRLYDKFSSDYTRVLELCE